MEHIIHYIKSKTRNQSYKKKKKKKEEKTHNSLIEKQANSTTNNQLTNIIDARKRHEIQNLIQWQRMSCFQIVLNFNILKTMILFVHAELFWHFHNPWNSDMDYSNNAYIYVIVLHNIIHTGDWLFCIILYTLGTSVYTIIVLLLVSFEGLLMHFAIHGSL